MPDPFTVPIDGVQPSQCYLNGRKLALATGWFDFDEPAYDPLPVWRFDGTWTLLDGHTRAFLARVAGADELVLVEHREDLPVDRYRECVDRCREAGVTSIADLLGRAVNAETFEERWVAQCERAAGELGPGPD